MSELRVMLTGGGTGGHVFPAIAVAQALRARRADARILFVGTERGLEAKAVPDAGFPIRFVRARGLSKHPLKAAEALFDNFVGMAQALRHVMTFAPHVIVGSGGYVSVPVNLAAWMLFKPTVLLEQNVVPGKATRFLSLRSSRVCVSFDATAARFGTRAVVTGNPVRDDILQRTREEGRARLGVPDDRFCILISGASQGARSVNDAMLAALDKWRDRSWHLLHLTGRLDFDRVSESVRATLREGEALRWDGRAFLEDMASAYAAADLVIARAGATTMAELTCRGLPAILIPYPHAGAHQVENARWLERAGGAVLIMDDEARGKLHQAVTEIMDDAPRRARMAAASAAAGHPQAAARIVDEILKVAGA